MSSAEQIPPRADAPEQTGLGRIASWPSLLSLRFDARHAVVLCALLHAVMFLWLFKTPAFYYERGSDTQHVYWPAVQKLLAGHMPYRDPAFFVEYPPFGTAFFLLPALLHPTSLRGYDWLFAGEIWVLDIATLPLVVLLARRQTISAVGAVFVYGLTLPLLGAVVCQRYDLLPAALTLGALLALLDRRSLLAWFLLFLATEAKLYPAVVAPLFALYEWRRDRSTRVYLYVLGLVASIIAWSAWAPASLHRFVLWEARRGIEIESLPASLAELAHLAGLPVRMVNEYGAYDVDSALTAPLKLLSTLATAGALLGIYACYLSRLSLWSARMERRSHGQSGVSRPRSFRAGFSARERIAAATRFVRIAVPPEAHDVEEARALITYTTLAILAVLLGSKLLSIQFLIWVLPLLAVQPHDRRRVAVIAIAMVLLSQWIYPMHWRDLFTFKRGLVLLTALRNGLLLASCLVIWISLWRDGTIAPTMPVGEGVVTADAGRD